MLIEWRKSTQVPISKNKGGVQGYTNYRKIKLMPFNKDLRKCGGIESEESCENQR